MFAQLKRRLVTFITMLVTLTFVYPGAAQEKDAHKGLELAWSLEGNFRGVVSDESKGTIYSIADDGKCVEIDLAGKQKREIKLNVTKGDLLRIATFPGSVGKALLVFSGWGDELRAHDLSGKELWTYANESGIDDVWAHDLNDDGSDEVIIGYNGSGGLQVLDSTGKLLWKSTAIGNVWHVCAGDLLGDGKQQVVTTSAEGKVHRFDADGTQGKDFKEGGYANMVRIGKRSGKEKAALILVVGSFDVPGGGVTRLLTAMTGIGTHKWLLELPDRASSAHMAPGKPWLAMGLDGGHLQVVDIDTGKLIASARNQGRAPELGFLPIFVKQSSPEVGWAKAKDGGDPLLLVATGSKLNAFRVAEKE